MKYYITEKQHRRILKEETKNLIDLILSGKIKEKKLTRQFVINKTNQIAFDIDDSSKLLEYYSSVKKILDSFLRNHWSEQELLKWFNEKFNENLEEIIFNPYGEELSPEDFGVTFPNGFTFEEIPGLDEFTNYKKELQSQKEKYNQKKGKKE